MHVLGRGGIIPPKKLFTDSVGLLICLDGVICKMPLCSGCKADRTYSSSGDRTAYVLAASSSHPRAIKFIFCTNVKGGHILSH